MDQPEPRVARILQACEPPDGGIINHILSLSTALVARGHEVTFAGPEESPEYPRLERAGVRIKRLPFTGSITALGPDSRTARALLGLIREDRFDVAHAHGMKAGWVLRPVSAVARVPVVYTPHGFPFLFSEHRQDLRHPRLRRIMALDAERVLGLITARLICVSQAEREYADRWHIAASSRRRVVRHGLQVDSNCEPDAGLLDWKGDGVLWGTVSALRWEKGIGRLLDAAALLEDAPVDLRLAIVGNGPERDTIARRIEQEGLDRRIRLFPFSGRPEPHLLALDGFIQPSDRWEALGIALIEAMACGLPAIGSRLGGIPEVIDEDVTGILVPPGDPGALADAIRSLAGDPARAAEMGRLGRERAASSFGLARMADEIERIYLEVAR